MSGNDLLERRAARGHPRGADSVWLAAGNTAHFQSAPSRPRPAPILRFAFVAGLIAIVGLAMFAVTRSDDVRRVDVAGIDVAGESEVAVETPAEASAELLPAPILVNGMGLQRVTAPMHPGLDGSGAVRLDGQAFAESTRVVLSSDEEPMVTAIFADPDDPFGNPIFGLNHFGDGGFRPWLINTGLAGDAERSDLLEVLTASVERVDGTWTMPPESGLVEVATVPATYVGFLEAGWQFDFASGPERVVLQAETTLPDEPAELTEWHWVARAMQGGSSPQALDVRETQVLDGSGLILSDLDRGSEEVTWARDGFVYRLLSSTVEGDRDVSGLSSAAIPRLVEVDREAWIEAVEAARSSSSGGGIGSVVMLFVALAFLGNVVWFLLRKSYLPAAILVVGPAVLLVFGSSAWGVAFVLAPLLALAGAWWQHLGQKSARSAQTAPE